MAAPPATALVARLVEEIEAELDVVVAEIGERIRAEIPDLTILGGHSSHSYINGTNMYFNYFYDLVDCPPDEEVTKYYLPIISIICDETLRFGGSIVHHHGIGECGVFTYEVAETKVTQVMDFARKHQHPLQCVMEKK